MAGGDAEIPVGADLINYYAGHAAEFLKESHPRPHSLLTAAKRLSVAYRPYPVVGVICPWNFPVLIALIDSVPALLAGAAVVVKPSEFTPLATRREMERMEGDRRPGRVRLRHGRGTDRRRARR